MVCAVALALAMSLAASVLGTPEVVDPSRCDDRDYRVCAVGYSLAMVELGGWRTLEFENRREKSGPVTLPLSREGVGTMAFY